VIERRAAIVCLLAVSLTGVCACAGEQSMFDPQGPAASRIALLGWALMAMSLVIYAAVMAALALAVRRRRTGDETPIPDARLTRAVGAASAATAIVLVALAVMTYVAARGLGSPLTQGAVIVDVIGHQWWWEFRYPGNAPPDLVSSPNELHIPVGVPVILRVTSRDVVHSFWVPNLHGKRDLIPGEVTRTWIQADRAGVYRGQCAEFCGYQHAKMAFHVVAEPPAAFARWLEQQRQPAQEPASGAAGDGPRRGREIFMQRPCATCHTIRGTDAGGRLGPELTHLASRRSLAAGALPNASEHLARWIVDAQSVKPGSRMPRVPLTAEERRAVVSYLESLR
jgi:cytochrome c oxidase subunit 2